MEVKDIYKNLLSKIRTEMDTVEIKRDYLLPQDSKYQYRRTLQSNGYKRPHILAYRKDKPIYLSSDEHFESFYSECTDCLDELICMSHEFGHHFSSDHEIDSLYDKIRDNGNCATPDEKRRVLEEENFAWDKAEAVLKELEFSDWDAFHNSKSRGLQSYQNNIHEWQPLSIDEAVQTLKSIKCQWMLAGGWALDTFLGEHTREHSDIDILVPRQDQLEIQKYLEGWDLQVGDPPGTLRVWKPGEYLEKRIHDIWARPFPESPWKIQFMLFDIENNEWVYRRKPTVRGSLESMSLKSSKGFLYLAPEIQLLYKSKGLRPKDTKDFESTLPALNQARRSWLKQALQISYPDGHDWIAPL